MVRKIIGILIITAFLSFTVTAYAATAYIHEGMAKKFLRGVVNTLTGWVEFPAQIVKGYNEYDNRLLGTALGFFEGLWHAGGRTLSGVTDIIGFWAANPEHNFDIGIPLDGKYAWVKGEPYSLCDPSFTDAALVPIGRKFLRGAGNSLAGFLELPGQVLKGISDGAYDLGILKGLYYWYSRQVSGLTDLITLPFPTPAENMGTAFDQKWPWGAYSEVME